MPASNKEESNVPQTKSKKKGIGKNKSTYASSDDNERKTIMSTYIPGQNISENQSDQQQNKTGIHSATVSYQTSIEPVKQELPQKPFLFDFTQ